jgi:DNA-binding NtrC family response regulator
VNRVLLILDDDEEIGDLFRLFLRKSFAQVHVAQNSAEAERILRQATVTHVVCDLTIGPDEPVGSVFLARWRGKLPSIQFAAIFTGAADRSAGERAVFEQSLEDAASWLREYFETDGTAVRSALAAIEEVRDEYVMTEPPDISGSLALLRQHRTLASGERTGEGADDDTQ